MKYDFAIVCPQRGGSCLLSTALNSHPDIWCDVNKWGLGADEKSESKITGRVIRYNVLSEINVFKPEKIIHLRRDLTEAATSLVMHKWNSRHTGRSLHRLRTQHISVSRSPLDSPFAEFFIEVIRNTLEEQLTEALHIIGPTSCFGVNYKELTDGDKDIEVLPEKLTDKILEFLGVPVRPLKTYLGKTGPYIGD